MSFSGLGVILLSQRKRSVQFKHLAKFKCRFLSRIVNILKYVVSPSDFAYKVYIIAIKRENV